jgi:hypothetical protein
MSSTTTLILSLLGGLLGGTAAGAGLTGWLAIRQQRRKRVQKRRAEVYVEMLAWIRWATTPPRLTADHAHSTNAGDPDVTKTAFPYAEAMNAENFGPDSKYHVTLRARLVAYGSHDVTRAFDRWTEAYRMVLAGRGNDLCQVDPNNSKVGRLLEHTTNRSAIVPDPQKPGTTNPHDRRHPDLPNSGGEGCLTRALERCASYELRKG